MSTQEKIFRICALGVAMALYGGATHFLQQCWDRPMFYDGLAGIVLATLAHRLVARLLFDHRPLLGQEDH